MATAPVPAPAPDLVVVGLGPVDRVELRDEVERIAAGDEVAAAVDALRTSEQLLLTQLGALPNVPVLFVDTGDDDLLARQLRAVDLRLEQVTASRARGADALATDLRSLVEAATRDRLRVLVIGDSTSYQLASALDTAGRDVLEVTWAGQQNCPLVPARRIRWSDDAEFDGATCPGSDGRWRTAMEAFRPDVVLASPSLPELGDQSYDGSTWVSPGDPRSTAAHDEGMALLQDLAREVGAVTLVATVPPLRRGAGFDMGPLAAPARLDAWLAQIDRWDAQWASVGRLDWAALAAEAERSAGRDLRIDAVHFDPTALAEVLAPPLVQAVVGAAARLRAEAMEAGCQAGPEDGPLRIARCRLP
jgi:hypothetical protein